MEKITLRIADKYGGEKSSKLSSNLETFNEEQFGLNVHKIENIYEASSIQEGDGELDFEQDADIMF
jgi:hypothetical protein